MYLCTSLCITHIHPYIPLYTVIHDNKYDYLAHRTRSYMEPCGHPWAALVLFDSLLVCVCGCGCIFMCVNVCLHGYNGDMFV